MTHTAGQAIVDALEGEGVAHVYGLPGGHVLSIYDGLYASPSIRHILVRHEHAAACMAAAHAQLKPAEIGRSVPAQIGIVGDLRAVLEQVLVGLRARDGLAPGAFAEQARTREVAEEIAQIDAESEELARARPSSSSRPGQCLAVDDAAVLDEGCEGVISQLPDRRLTGPLGDLPSLSTKFSHTYQEPPARPKSPRHHVPELAEPEPGEPEVAAVSATWPGRSI